ncbi:hypothetical protein RD055328_08390 [Companilactobacillus sp. RD055328]|uniref:phage head-tail connector protein n=1 Tax=Companilactobacillus sp. RD055328 TaxID=2916634 RepID=UPI001FC874BA|nr:phage head-tail connector protein [Companilactobacillus sp. RD055328]GKQ42916.1 hypothetical protein RD055328_08390 [Companilactobacillus sp. RD055328]
MSDYLDRIKRLLFIENSTDEEDKRIQDIVDMTVSRLKVLTGLKDNLPKDINYIVVEVSIKRFNRLKNEGMSAYSQEGESITFKDDDFKEFENDINKYADDKNKKNVVKFINPYQRVRK